MVHRPMVYGGGENQSVSSFVKSSKLVQQVPLPSRNAKAFCLSLHYLNCQKCFIQLVHIRKISNVVLHFDIKKLLKVQLEITNRVPLSPLATAFFLLHFLMLDKMLLIQRWDLFGWLVGREKTRSLR